MRRRRHGGGTIWVGIDDTDSPRGGCTTWVLTELLVEARDQAVDVIGEPRLVRLNPNIPWKTRGNAALSVRFGHGVGPTHRIGAAGGRALRAFDRGRPLPADRAEAFREVLWQRVLAGSERGEPGTDPAMVATSRRLPADLYWKAVREVVAVPTVRALLERSGAWWRTQGSDRGLVGAAASIAWGGGHPTWELTSYRTANRLGTVRRVDPLSVIRASRAHPSLFLCHDPRTRRLLVAPHTACPVLFGLRGTRPGPLLRARPAVRSESPDRWVLFRTNQGTGDHLRPWPAGGVGPYQAARFRAEVSALPVALPGGHVRLSVTTRTGRSVVCLAFEPTKTLPRVAARLAPGDRVELWGSRGTDPVIRLEGLRLLALAPRFAPPSPPMCAECRRPTRSLGTARGFRCPTCARRYPPERAVRRGLPPPLPLGEYHPTPSARRHLAPRGPEEVL